MQPCGETDARRAWRGRQGAFDDRSRPEHRRGGEAEQRSSRHKDLLLGVILLASGVLVGVLWYDTMATVVSGWLGNDAPTPEGKVMPGPVMYLIGFFAIGAILVGTHKLLRGVGVLRR